MKTGANVSGAARGLFGIATIVSAFALGGCVEQVADANLALPSHPAIARNPGVSPAGAAIAFASLDGAPSAALERFVASLRAEAAAREITLAEPGKARYQVRGYLSAATGSNGALVSYVWDVFDSGKRRALRVSDAIMVPGARGDVWSALDERAMRSLAAKSADDLAAFLSNTPEAVAAARLRSPARPQIAAPPSIRPSSGAEPDELALAD